MIPLFFTLSYYNSHAHVERDKETKSKLDVLKDFNSHAHVERDSFHFPRLLGDNISTHTLTWSVTI